MLPFLGALSVDGLYLLGTSGDTVRAHVLVAEHPKWAVLAIAASDLVSLITAVDVFGKGLVDAGIEWTETLHHTKFLNELKATFVFPQKVRFTTLYLQPADNIVDTLFRQRLGDARLLQQLGLQTVALRRAEALQSDGDDGTGVVRTSVLVDIVMKDIAPSSDQ